MTELERLAQLGNKEAQEECTRQGILIPCPFCGSRMKLLEGNSYFGSWMTMCNWCGAKTSETGNKVLAIAASNRRPAPPRRLAGAPAAITGTRATVQADPAPLWRPMLVFTAGTSHQRRGIAMKRLKPDKFDREFYIRRNKSVALELYGSRLDENRRVKGTDIWFDENWIFHRGYKSEGESK